MQIRVLLLLGLLSASTPTVLNAADAGSLLREQNLPAPQTPQRKDVVPKVSEAPAPAAAGPTLHVSAFTISGATVFSEAELLALIDEFRNRDISMGQLEQAIARITAYYRSHGYPLAGAILPRQEVREGKVRIEVVEGRLGDIKVTGGSRTSANMPRGLIAAAMPSGAPIRQDQMERGILLANDLAGVRLKSTITPGATTGASDLLVDVSDGPLVDSSIDFDTYGSRFSGRERGTGRLALNSPSGRGDQATLMITGSEGLQYVRAGYTTPLENLGLKVGIAYSYMHYELLDPFDATGAKGDSNTVSANASWSVIRSQNTNLTATLNYDYKLLFNDSNTGTVSDKDIHLVTLSLVGSRSDDWLGGGFNTAMLGIGTGWLDLSGCPGDRANDAISTRADGSFGKFTYAVSRSQAIIDTVSASLALNGQFAFSALDSAEKISLGGPFAVRAYPQNEANGDSGHILNLDIRWILPWHPLSSSITANAFYDHGFVTLHNNTWAGWQGSSSTIKNSYDLKGAGFGLSWFKSGDFSLTSSLAWKIGDNPGRDAKGNDNDGTDRTPQFWIQLSKSFSFF